MTGVLRVGLAGAGWVTQHHLDAWATQSSHATVVAIADPNVPAARARAAQFDIPAVYDSVEAMVQALQLDAIDVAAPREFHAPICRLAAQHGLAILCQKPLAPTLAEAEALVREVNDRVPFMVHENWRFRPHYRRIAEWLNDGSIGAVRRVTMNVLTSGLLPDATGRLPALLRQPMIAGLDRMLLMEILIHHIDTLRFLLGPLMLQSATLGKSCNEIRGEDRATLQLRTAAGAAVTLCGDFMAHGHPPEQRDALEIAGTHGAIVLEAESLRMIGAVEESLTLDLAANYGASYEAAIAHFLDGVRHGAFFETSPEDNLETLRIVEAAYRMSSLQPG